ncbi:TolC family protein [Myxococcus sp. RHSTA-1-4]|uniref:TolC family protein n=1 Tax=Myxococcus sp. RHSTA-1-4 TaxID=2874601 RepID=UPI001CBEA7B7|nr:TolC family protein [Myxococcus sp. RHSTA-1-4]MBZ4416820.1 TolC family protein [Myxococcus sp. RHSTA-1-4]
MVVALTALLLAAAPAEPVPLSFAEALDAAGRAPLPAATARALEAKRAEDARISGLVANPQLTVEPGWRRQEAVGSGLDLRVGVAQPLNLSGQSGARREAARLETESLSEEARARLLSRRLAMAEAWLGLWAAEQAQARAAEEVQLAAEFQKAVEAAAALGASTRLEVAEAVTHAAEARLAELDAQGLVAERRAQLSRQLGRAAAQPPLSTRGPLPEVTLPPESRWPELLALAARKPDVTALALGARAERARANELRASRGFQLQLGASALREYDGAVGGVATLGLTPPLFDHAERERGPLLAQAARLEGEAGEAAAAAFAELSLAFHEVEHSHEVVELLKGTLLPGAEEAANLSVLLFRAGDTTVLEVVRLRRVLASARIRLGHALADEALARVRVRFLIDAADISTPEGSTP